MQIITKDEVRLKGEEIIERMQKGDVFIHPTDTIYGLGCDATKSKSIKKIREIKQRPDTPFSVMAPSIEWIEENCIITKEAEKWLKELPGPLTLILKLKNEDCVSKEVAPGLDSIGVRFIDHWMQHVVTELGVPIISTSVNKTDTPFMTDIENLDSKIKMSIPFALYEGPKPGRPSKIIHLESEETTIKER